MSGADTESYIPFHEFCSTIAWKTNYEYIIGRPAHHSFNFNEWEGYREEYERLEGNQPSLSMLRSGYTYDDFFVGHDGEYWFGPE